MILVTGAAGFIGTHLINELTKSYDIATIDIRDLPTVPERTMHFKADIRSVADMDRVAEALKEEEVTACLHLAAIASPPIAQKDPATAWSTNVEGTHNVLQLLHKLKCPRMIFFSSAHVYGISPKYMPTDENHPRALHDTYTTTKIVGEDLCRLFYDNHDISYVVLRLWNAYGPGQSPDYFIGKKISQALKGGITLRNEGVTKDWVHVSDVVRAAYLALSTGYVGPLNIGTGKETSLGDIVRKISEIFKLPEITLENVPDEGPTRMLCDWKRAQKVLGWSPSVPFEKGLIDLIERAKIAAKLQN